MREIKRAHTKSMFVQRNSELFRGRVLDVGCGNLAYKRIFWAPDLNDYRPDTEVTEWVGLDIRPVGDVQSPAEDMPLEDESFDTVMCLDMLHQAADPAAVISECLRVLKPGGALLILVLNSYPEDTESYWNIKKNGLDMLLARHGFEEGSMTIAGLMTSEAEAYLGTSKYRMKMSNTMQGLIGGLDEHYPLFTVAIVEKESPSDNEEADPR